MLWPESLFTLKYWLNFIWEINIWKQSVFSAAIPSGRKGAAWPRFVRHCSWSWKWTGIASSSNCAASWQKDPFASSQYVWSFGPSNGPYGKTNASCWNPEMRASQLTFQALLLSLKCLYLIPFFLSSCLFFVQIDSQPIYLHKKQPNKTRHVNY